MSGKITGGCRCGAVRYEIGGEPKASVICQCLDCQKFSGSGNLASMMVPADKLNLSGETATYEYTGGSGNTVRKVFFPTCGCHVYGGPVGASVVMVRAGDLDDPGIFKPGMVVHAESGSHWDRVNPDIPRR